jgi:hypothetical protein
MVRLCYDYKDCLFKGGGGVTGEKEKKYIQHYMKVLVDNIDVGLHDLVSRKYWHRFT